MSSIFDINRSEFQKIFNHHQLKGLLSYTDSLKICNTLKIFPDLLSSQELRKIFLTLCFTESGVERIDFTQFESFLKICAKQAFKQRKLKSSDYESLIRHIKDASRLKYGVNLEYKSVKSFSKNSLGKSAVKITLTPKRRINNISRPTSEKTLNQSISKGKSLASLRVPSINVNRSMLSPRADLTRKFEKKNTAVTDRKLSSSRISEPASPYRKKVLGKIQEAFSEFQCKFEDSRSKSYMDFKATRSICYTDTQVSNKNLIKRISFAIWKFNVV